MDPTSSPTESETAGPATAVLAAMRAGNLLEAFDLAERGLAQAPEDVELKYLSVLVLARSGATELAARRFKRLGLDNAPPDPGTLAVDVPALAARLAKDRALNARGCERIRLLLVAADAYRAVFEKTGDAYPGVNFAALTLWAGQREKAAAVSSRILDRLARNPVPAQTFWSLATEAELRLITGDVPGATAAVRSAAQALRTRNYSDWAAASSTRRQLLRTCRLRDIDPVLLEPLRPPAVAVYGGHIPEALCTAGHQAILASTLAAQMETHTVACGYGQLSGIADVLFAEALLARGGELHVIFPFAHEECVARSTAALGPEWGQRLRRCRSLARSVRQVTNDSDLGDDAPQRLAARLAMGRACLRSQQMDSNCIYFALCDVGQISEPRTTADAVADLQLWGRLDRKTHQTRIIDATDGAQRRPVSDPLPPPPSPAAERINGAILFADIQGFGHLNESDLPAYVASVLTPIARLLERYDRHVLTRNSWGDAIFAVFDDVAAAAECAFALQGAITEGHDAPRSLHPNIRVAVHYGPVRAIFDPIQGRESYMGVQVTQAARIEPVTEPGMIYVTEAFAAALALIPAAAFACDYLGQVDTAKNSGRRPLYALRAKVPDE